MLSLASSPETKWSSVDITSAFLNADIHEDDTVLVMPPPILVKMDTVKPNTVWHVKEAIYGLREAPRLWQKERDQQLRELEFMYQDKLDHLVQSHIHPRLWFMVEGALAEHPWTPPFDHSLRSDEWTTQLHCHRILGYMGVYVGRNGSRQSHQRPEPADYHKSEKTSVSSKTSMSWSCPMCYIQCHFVIALSPCQHFNVSLAH